MNFDRALFLALLASTPALAHCEVVAAPPPAAPQPAPPPPPPQDQPAPPPPQGQGAAPDDGQGVTAGAEAPPADSYEDNDPSALTDFHGALDPYGTWVDDPTYGTVWVPSPNTVGADFTPYSTGGHWTYDNDYVWASDYPWGWAPFHYGRWVLIDGRGWSWIPGREYRGAWVTWGVDDGGGYAGWYPLAPTFVWRGGVAIGYTPIAPPPPRWTYVPRGEVFSPVVGTRVIRGPAAVAVAARVRPFNPGTPGVSGPPPARLGFNPAQVPHPSPAAVGRAQQFAHPSTAVAAGGHPPARVVANAGNSNGRFVNGRANGRVETTGRAGGNGRVETNGRLNEGRPNDNDARNQGHPNDNQPHANDTNERYQDGRANNANVRTNDGRPPAGNGQPGDDRQRYANDRPVNESAAPNGARNTQQPQRIAPTTAPHNVPRTTGGGGRPAGGGHHR